MIEKEIPTTMTRARSATPKLSPFEIALMELGVSEIAGRESNPRIDEYLATVGQSPDDEISWCSAFVNWCHLQASMQGTGSAAARSWMEWGYDVSDAPKRGDVVIFWRESPSSWKGHVAFFADDDSEYITVLGGNQRNCVCFKSYSKDRLLGIRRLII